ncbi:PepSY-associated TM helix domain-containing protein [Polaribacter sargassicola]|uniref:PepSY-associated TM helix domain-containing protein n=1 Tax=Polaribacter sargassicola TaxID=2836891 RepID=UPI001F3F42A3|nr:PepSY-associated TM helix domain-containing protein [Polaribacter sp. DS7-9]MCG1036121.1 PepSY domain-containing protein [Polaribacter sp. DS7-9]
MSKKNYNIFFNTHTVSGIVISVALYVIFFAGAFSLFKDEISLWEEGKPLQHIEKKDVNFDKILNNLHQEHNLTGRDLSLNFNFESDHISITLEPQKDTINNQKDIERKVFFVNTNTFESKTYEEQYSLGEFIYRLHYFRQLPIIGQYLSGFVSLFFLFAIVTGVIVHWKKIIPNFFQFNPKVTLKRIWTDSHTALGVIGLPFQFIFAVTGAYLGIGLLVLLPATFLYNGSQEKLIEDVRPARKTYEWVNTSNQKALSFNTFAKKTNDNWNDFFLTRAFIRNYGGNNMEYVLIGELNDNKRYIGIGRIVYNAYTGQIQEVKSPEKLGYLEDSQRLLARLHFADFGGYWIKIVYFILALITCFVIITGVLIYIEARNKKSMTLKQRLFTAKVGHIYLAICLSMFPIIALSFLLIKLLPEAYMDQRMNILYAFFFTSWLIATLFFRYKRDNYFTNKINLLAGSILGFLIPITNGIVSNNWIWNTYKNHQYEILSVDILWLILSITALLIYLKIKPAVKEQSSFTKHPIDFKNRKKLLLEEKNNLSVTNKTEITDKNLQNKNHISMRTKIIILWIFLAIGWIVHHIYGLFNIYYNETLMIEGATGDVPTAHHIYRILFEGLCLLFGLLTLEVSKKWFKWVSLIWAIITGLYNVYHFVEAIIYESTNISEIFMLALVSIASIFLIKNLINWKKEL